MTRTQPIGGARSNKNHGCVIGALKQSDLPLLRRIARRITTGTDNRTGTLFFSGAAAGGCWLESYGKTNSRLDVVLWPETHFTAIPTCWGSSGIRLGDGNANEETKEDEDGNARSDSSLVALCPPLELTSL
jgi:hypothetical protein